MEVSSFIGNKIIGRAYRPNRITNSPNRGYLFDIKCKSNFGGLFNTNVEVKMEYDIEAKTENVVINTTSDNGIKVVARVEKFKKINRNSAINPDKIRIIRGIRSIVKPDMYNFKKSTMPIKIKNIKGVLYLDLFINSEYEDEKDTINIVLYPTRIENEEYLAIECESQTPIKLVCKNGVLLK